MKVLLIILALALTSCRSVPTPDERLHHADSLAARHDWYTIPIQAGQFELTAYLPGKRGKADTLTVYLEGDGFAWRTSRQPSSDPTPLDPMALRLALAHPQGNAAYLARPCQFKVKQDSRYCGIAYWTDKRFSPEVIAATSMALDDLKKTFGARQLYLVGYSGGGAIAALVAARRSDVLLLVTVAGNLDVNYWTQLHHLTPLTHSLNPVDAKQELAQIRQVHWSGGKDQIVPAAVAKAFASDWPSKEKPSIRIVKDNDHLHGWVENWPALWKASLQSRQQPLIRIFIDGLQWLVLQTTPADQLSQGFTSAQDAPPNFLAFLPLAPHVPAIRCCILPTGNALCAGSCPFSAQDRRGEW